MISGHSSSAKKPATKKVLICNEKGLHARAAARFASVASDFIAHITVEKDDKTVLASSIMGLMMLAAGRGTHIRITALGDDQKKALKTLVCLVESKFGEPK